MEKEDCDKPVSPIYYTPPYVSNIECGGSVLKCDDCKFAKCVRTDLPFYGESKDK